MSKLKPESEYKKTFASKFITWINGSEDPYVGKVEMQPQHEEVIPEQTIIERMKEREMINDQIYDIERNPRVLVFNRIYRIVAAVFCIALTIFLILSVANLPSTGVREKPDNNEVGTRYIEQGTEETGAINFVTGMILTYRAFDTFGETNVLFIATICVMISLLLEEKVVHKREQELERILPEKYDTILQMVAKFLVPIIIIFGIYVVLNGQNSPGGGFSGGAILGAALILYNCAFGFKKTQKFFDEKVYEVAKITALCMYGLVGIYYYTCGANGIANHIPLGIPGAILSGGIILPIDICVGIEVACTMYAFYALFKRGNL